MLCSRRTGAQYTVLCNHGCGDQHTEQSHTHQASSACSTCTQSPHHMRQRNIVMTHWMQPRGRAALQKHKWTPIAVRAFVSPLINNQHYTPPVQLHMRMLHTLARPFLSAPHVSLQARTRRKQATPPYIQTLIRLTLVGARIQCAHWGVHSPLANGRLGLARAAGL